MAFKLSLDTYTTGLEAQAARSLATLKHFATIAPPIDEAAMRADLETAQFQAFDNDEWNVFMAQMAAVSLDESVLTPTEVGIMNVLKAVSNPDPSTDYCGVDVPASSNCSLTVQPLLGSATWEHAIQLKMAVTTDCNVKSVDVTLTGVPATLPTPTIKLLFEKSTAAGRFFKYYYTSYAGNPTGVNYAVTLDFKDENDVSILSFVPTWSPVTFP